MWIGKDGEDAVVSNFKASSWDSLWHYVKTTDLRARFEFSRQNIAEQNRSVVAATEIVLKVILLTFEAR